LGGTFDPIHNGHLELAETAVRLAKLDAVYFVTSFDPPHKNRKALANFLDRHAMVALAVIDHTLLIPSSMEYGRSGKSYSVDTVRQLGHDLGVSTQIFFLIGMDAFLEIRSWKEYRVLPDLCSFIIFSRPGLQRKDLEDKLPETFRNKLFPISEAAGVQHQNENCCYLVDDFSSPISSTEIRNEVRSGRSISAWVPEGVSKYIEKTKLYSSKGDRDSYR
jgi:nicotinate-nucleotide adenylyltransferase